MDALLRRLEAIGETHAELRTLQIATIAEAQRNVPRRTGFLQRNIRPGEVTAEYAVVKASTPYAATVEFGSRPHIIKPRNARVLAWGGPRRLTGRLRKGAKATNFARLVHHPGTRPHPYLIPAAKESTRLLLDIITGRWNRAG